jgi:hypothetical protein
MKKFQFSIFVFSLIPFVFVFVVVNLEYDNINEAQAQKIRFFIKDPTSFNILVAGDSRGERGGIPKILKGELGCNTYNISSGGGTLRSVYRVLEKYKIISGNKQLIIISTSFPQVNDSAYKYIPVGLAELNIPFFDIAILMHRDLGRLIGHYRWHFRKKLFRDSIQDISTRVVLPETLGYLPVYEKFSFPSDEWVKKLLNKNLSSSTWYQNIKTDGITQKLFLETLLRFSKTKHDIYIYNPPFNPYMKRKISGSFIDTAEKFFSEMLTRESAKYQNIHFIDFYNSPPPDLKTEDFYDMTHLNNSGAVKLSKSIAKAVRGKSYGELCHTRTSYR